MASLPSILQKSTSDRTIWEKLEDLPPDVRRRLDQEILGAESPPCRPLFVKYHLSDLGTSVTAFQGYVTRLRAGTVLTQLRESPPADAANAAAAVRSLVTERLLVAVNDPNTSSLILQRLSNTLKTAVLTCQAIELHEVKLAEARRKAQGLGAGGRENIRSRTGKRREHVRPLETETAAARLKLSEWPQPPGDTVQSAPEAATPLSKPKASPDAAAPICETTAGQEVVASIRQSKPAGHDRREAGLPAHREAVRGESPSHSAQQSEKKPKAVKSPTNRKAAGQRPTPAVSQAESVPDQPEAQHGRSHHPSARCRSGSGVATVQAKTGSRVRRMASSRPPRPICGSAVQVCSGAQALSKPRSWPLDSGSGRCCSGCSGQFTLPRSSHRVFPSARADSALLGPGCSGTGKQKPLIGRWA